MSQRKPTLYPNLPYKQHYLLCHLPCWFLDASTLYLILTYNRLPYKRSLVYMHVTQQGKKREGEFGERARARVRALHHCRVHGKLEPRAGGNDAHQSERGMYATQTK